MRPEAALPLARPRSHCPKSRRPARGNAVDKCARGPQHVRNTNKCSLYEHFCCRGDPPVVRPSDTVSRRGGGAEARERQMSRGGTDDHRATRAVASGQRIRMRFAAIWIALVVLVAVSAVLVPRSLQATSILAIAPLAAFLAMTAMGEALVLMMRGIDLSIPAVITLSSSVILGMTGGENGGLALAIVVALALSLVVGVINGVLVALFKLNALIVTLAVGTILTGLVLWYREGVAQEASVPPLLADWGEARFLSINSAIWVAAALTAVLTVGLRLTTVGRRFVAVGANPRAAWIAGLPVTRHQVAAYAIAATLYGVAGILLAAFIRNPTLEVGANYLLAPIAAAVLGGTAVTGGIGSMIAIGGAALFLTQLGQILRMLDLSTAIQFMIHGVAIALGMGLANLRAGTLHAALSRIFGRTADRIAGAP
ncbi:MAG: ABC transporter permease [Alphaproteobacteria bacterium]